MEQTASVKKRGHRVSIVEYALIAGILGVIVFAATYDGSLQRAPFGAVIASAHAAP
jgi:hypothetical protein